MFEGYIVEIIKEKIFLGAFFGTLIETVFPPLPSEFVLPLVGYFLALRKLGIFGLLYSVTFSSIGATLGALIYYYLSLKLGRRFVERYGKYLFINKKKLQAAENWFKKYGNKAVFFGRMAPGIRELVSIPAGLLKMNLREYIFYTFFGSFVWSFFLISLGYAFGLASIPSIRQFSNILAVLIFLSLISYLLFKKLLRKYSPKILNRKNKK